MLLAGLQRESVGGGAVGILGDADQAARQLPLQSGAHGKVAGVRPAEAERNAEALRGSGGNIGPEFARGGQQGERQQVSRHDGEPSRRFHRSDRGARVPDAARGSGVLDERAEHLAVGDAGEAAARQGLDVGKVGLDQLDSQRVGAVGQ